MWWGTRRRAPHNYPLLQDYYKYPTPALPAANQLDAPLVVDIAAAHGVTPAQVLIAWQWALGVPTNPRSMNQQHMIDNLNAFTALTLNQTEIRLLSSQPQAWCTEDSYYECA